MLNKLRNFAKTKIAGVVIGIIIIPFVFWGMGGVFSGGSTETGAIKITLPQYYTNTMMSMTVRVYNYQDHQSFELHCGGYNYLPNNHWYNTTAYILGGTNVGRNYQVRFGDDGSKCCIWIGETSSTWTYPQVYVKEFQAGHTNFSIEAIPQSFNMIPDFGKRITCTIPQNGDLVGEIILYIRLPTIPPFFNSVTGEEDTTNKIAWIKKIGYGIIQKQQDLEDKRTLLNEQYDLSYSIEEERKVIEGCK